MLLPLTAAVHWGVKDSCLLVILVSAVCWNCSSQCRVPEFVKVLKVLSVPRFNHHPLRHRDRCSWIITVAELNGQSEGREPNELL